MSGFQNSDRFRHKIAQLKQALRDSIRQAMAQTADEIVAAMKNLVPVAHGELRDSIAWCWGKPPKGAVAFTSLTHAIGNSDSFLLTIYAGNYKAFYARWVEFGTRGHAAGGYRDDHGRKRNAGKRGHHATPAEPFFFPIWRAYKKRLRTAIARILNQAIRQIKAQ